MARYRPGDSTTNDGRAGNVGASYGLTSFEPSRTRLPHDSTIRSHIKHKRIRGQGGTFQLTSSKVTLLYDLYTPLIMTSNTKGLRSLVSKDISDVPTLAYHINCCRCHRLTFIDDQQAQKASRRADAICIILVGHGRVQLISSNTTIRW